MRTILVAAVFAALIPIGCTGALADDGPDATDLQACRFLTDGVKTAFLDIDGDGSLERLSIVHSGVDRIPDFAINRADGSAVAVTRDHLAVPALGAFDPLRDDRNADETWMVFAGRAYLLHFDRFARYLSRIDSSFVERRACAFGEPPLNASFFSLSDTNEFVCDAVLHGAVTYIPIEPVRPRHDAGGPVGDATIVGTTTVDFGNDGHPQELDFLKTESTDGKSCVVGYYDTAPDQRGTRERTALMAIQSTNTSPFPGHECSDYANYVTQWFTFRGVQYLETRYPSLDPHGDPGDDTLEERHTVKAIGQGRPPFICEETSIRDMPPSVLSVWSGTAWIAPPADMPPVLVEPEDQH